jgi:hypothetical protein
MTNLDYLIDETGRLKPGYFLKLRDIEVSPSKGLRGLVPYSRATIYRMMGEGRFPRPIKLSTKSSAWLSEDIQKVRDTIAGQGAHHEA